MGNRANEGTIRKESGREKSRPLSGYGGAEIRDYAKIWQPACTLRRRMATGAFDEGDMSSVKQLKPVQGEFGDLVNYLDEFRAGDWRLIMLGGLISWHNL